MESRDGASELHQLEAAGDYEAMIDGVREAVRADARALTDPWVKEWCGRRWRNIFVTAAAADPEAVRAASERIGIPGTDLKLRTGRDRRPERQRIAERFLRHPSEEDWTAGLPPPRTGGSFGATLVLCPGLINSMLPMRAFQRAFPALNAKRGWRIIAADAHPVRSSQANVADLVAAIERGEGLDHKCTRIGPGEGTPPGDVVLLCYSKGAPDALTMLVERPDLAARIRAMFFWGGAVGGSYLADSIYDGIKDLEIHPGLGGGLKRVLQVVCPLVRLEGVSERIDEYNVKGALRDLTTSERAAFLAEHSEAIDALDVPIFNITAATTALEAPTFQAQGYLDVRKAGNDPDNDMQVTQAQARMTTPMATDLAVLHAHHWDISYDPFPIHMRMGAANLDHQFPREAAVQAIVELVMELGLA